LFSVLVYLGTLAKRNVLSELMAVLVCQQVRQNDTRRMTLGSTPRAPAAAAGMLVMTLTVETVTVRSRISGFRVTDSSARWSSTPG